MAKTMLALSRKYIITLIFLFRSTGVTTHLHSFPTRRSSDLPVPLGRLERQPVGIVPHVAVDDDSRAPVAQLRRLRSEEHTSELQSHHDLVCRLILEKKRQNDKSQHEADADFSERQLRVLRGS